MRANLSPHRTAGLEALLVTFLWSTSWVLVKIGLKDIPALQFAGLRYSLGFLCLLPLLLVPTRRERLRRLPLRTWGLLLMLGILYYTLTQGTQFVGLAYLPAITVNLILSFTSVLVGLMGIRLLGERPSGLQWAGVGVYVLGALAYFYPLHIPAAEIIGYAVVVVGLLANAGSSILGRSVNRRGDLSPIEVTVVSMGIGSIGLMIGGLAVEGLPMLSGRSWLIIAYLAVVNTALAFSMWNHSLRTLTALESSVINSTMMVQIPILAVIFLGESVSLRQGVGLVLAVAGTLAVQLGGARRSRLDISASETAEYSS
ncbi:MAG TPA: EamA family transporter [Anaerolineales bacterium]|nr:EamA family transporter [Anaerolineales bacterium]